MSRFNKLSITFLLLTTLIARQLQTVYDVIIIGAGAAGVGASVALSQNNVNHMILEARSRFGGRTFDTTVSGVTVDLGASFVHNPEKSNAIDSYVKKLNWGSTLANMSSAETLYQTASSISSSDKSTAQSILTEYQTYLSNQVSSGTDIDLSTAWDNYKTSVANKSYSTAALDRAKFDLYLEANLNGADLNTVSGIAYSSQSAKGAYDYLPQTSYAALIQAIYNNYCKNAAITYKQEVKNIDYSGQVVKITTAAGTVYYAKKVINTIPLGVLKSGSVTFTPALPTDYQTAIASIGMGIFNKVIVTLNGTFWSSPSSTRVVDLVVPADQTVEFPQFYVAPTDPKLLLFFVSGNNSKSLNSQKNDTQLIQYLKTIINKYSSSALDITSYNITRWQTDPYSLGSYSYYKVGTTAAHFKTLMTNINSKLWFAGEHAHNTQSSNVHGAFQSGMWAGQGASPSSAWEMWGIVSIVCMSLLLLV